MCEFCHKHGEGKKWYLNMKNYSAELAGEITRKKFLNTFYQQVIEGGNRDITRLERIFGKGTGRTLPYFIQNPLLTQHKKEHFGQVLPIEDVKELFDMVSSITRMTCGCRWAAEKKEERVCYGITLGAHEWYREFDLDSFGKPDLSDYEAVDRETAIAQMKELELKGKIHSIWTFITPFIGGICNCDAASGCLAMRSTYGLGIPTMFRAEYVADIDPAKCSGCRKCEKICPVAAVIFSSADKKSAIDKTRCYGCGICRTACTQNAIVLCNRQKDSVAAQYW